jgi:hypothetical protein
MAWISAILQNLADSGCCKNQLLCARTSSEIHRFSPKLNHRLWIIRSSKQSSYWHGAPAAVTGGGLGRFSTYPQPLLRLLIFISKNIYVEERMTLFHRTEKFIIGAIKQGEYWMPA